MCRRAIAKQIAVLPKNRQRLQQPVIRNRHWCFLLGRNLLLLGASEAALFLIEAPGGLAIIEQRQQDAFLKAAGQLGFALSTSSIVRINISKGQNVIIFLYSAEMFDANASKE